MVVAVLTAIDVTTDGNKEKLCGEANLQHHEAPQELGTNDTRAAVRYDMIGGKSVDRGLLLWANQFIPVNQLVTERDIKTALPCSQTYMLSATAISLYSKPDEVMVMVESAPEYVLPRCTRFTSQITQEVATDQF